MIVYKITNSLNTKVYVGQTKQKDPDRRWRQHKWYARNSSQPCHNPAFYKAMRELGINNFTFTILETLPEGSTQAQLDAAEVRWGTELKALVPDGYSLQLGFGRDNVCGITKAKMSDARSAWWSEHEIDDTLRARMSEMARGNTNRLGATLSEETKRRISEAQIGKELSDEHKQRIADASLAYHADHHERTEAQQEATRKAQDAARGKEAWNKGKQASEETRQKLSEAHKGQVAWNKGIRQFTPEEQAAKKRLAGKEYAAKKRAERGVTPRPAKLTDEERKERKRLENKKYRAAKKEVGQP